MASTCASWDIPNVERRRKRPKLFRSKVAVADFIRDILSHCEEPNTTGKLSIQSRTFIGDEEYYGYQSVLKTIGDYSTAPVKREVRKLIREAKDNG